MITICIPVYNSQKFLRQVVSAVDRFGSFPFLIYDNESTDQTRDIISDLMKTHNIKTKIVTRIEGGRVKNIGNIRNKLAQDVETEFTFFLDSDIIITASPITLIPLLTDKIGEARFRYMTSNHPTIGATLMRTAVSKTINFNLASGCECMNAKEQTEKMGLGQVWSCTAIHLKGDNHARGNSRRRSTVSTKNRKSFH
jgi:glycosyltransferase involved in cell wall biosynthesis